MNARRLTELVGVGVHVDDVITFSTSRFIEHWTKFLLFYLFTEAELVSSPLKNSTKASKEVEFNGFNIAKKRRVEQDRVGYEGDDFRSNERLVLEMRDSTRHKLKVLLERYIERRKWKDMKRLEGYMSWFGGVHEWYKGTAQSVGL